MIREQNKKETYLYGTFFALVQEQLSAIDKSVSGTLGIWGRNRMHARNKAMHKFMRKILKYKLSNGSKNPLEEFIEDIEFIESDHIIWDDITEEHLEYVRDILAFALAD